MVMAATGAAPAATGAAPEAAPAATGAAPDAVMELADLWEEF